MSENETCDASGSCYWRLIAYKELVGRVNTIFSSLLSEYCCNCQQVISRLPEARDESFDLVEGVYPGCCHRGAGDIFRLEGQKPERSHLAPEIIDDLQRERRLRLRDLSAKGSGGTYKLLRHLDNRLTLGAHCQYFTAEGCSLGELKGPLCINFICPPMRQDLLVVCADENCELIGPEQDFLFIYRTLVTISYERREEVIREIAFLERRLADFTNRCRQFLAEKQASSIYECFNR